MLKNETEIHVSRCLLLIEEALGWGKSSDWTSYDFSKLSDEVHNRTQVRLSVTTLKRIWGKLKYDNAPTLTTLNTLAQFAGYPDWRSFCKQEAVVDATAQPEVQTNRKQKVNRYWYLMSVPIIIGAYFLILSKDKFTSDAKDKQPKPDASKFEFKADKMKTEGVPNSVVFHYDASAATTDSVFIVQTWDISRKKLLSKSNHDHSAIYYYPGFFRTKLIADGEIVKTHDLWITSDGWLALIEKEPIPIYFRKDEYTFDDRVEVNSNVLNKYNLDLQPSPPHLLIFNQRDLGDMMSDNYTFETKVKTDFKDGNGACQLVYVLIQCKDDIIAIPLSAKSCVGNLELYYCGKGVQSENADLSGFGCDLDHWTKLRVEVVNKVVKIFVNDKKAYELTFPHMATGVVGVQYRFSGTGAVKDAWFENEKGRITL